MFPVIYILKLKDSRKLSCQSVILSLNMLKSHVILELVNTKSDSDLGDNMPHVRIASIKREWVI